MFNPWPDLQWHTNQSEGAISQSNAKFYMLAFSKTPGTFELFWNTVYCLLFDSTSPSAFNRLSTYNEITYTYWTTLMSTSYSVKMTISIINFGITAVPTYTEKTCVHLMAILQVNLGSATGHLMDNNGNWWSEVAGCPSWCWSTDD